MASSIVAVLRFVRAPLVVTVWSHLLAGGVITQWMPLSLWTGFTCVYFFGMAHNDWVDRERDMKLNPTRPLPSRALAEHAARLILAMLGLGLAFSYFVASQDPSIGVLSTWLPFSFFCAVGYNNAKERFPKSSALLLGAARASVWGPFSLIPAALVGLYGTLVTLWSHTEDRHPQRKSQTLKFLLMLPLMDALLLGVATPGSKPPEWYLVFPALSLLGYAGVQVLRRS